MYVFITLNEVDEVDDPQAVLRQIIEAIALVQTERDAAFFPCYGIIRGTVTGPEALAPIETGPLAHAIQSIEHDQIKTTS